jgi:hypothetical protein
MTASKRVQIARVAVFLGMTSLAWVGSHNSKNAASPHPAGADVLRTALDSYSRFAPAKITGCALRFHSGDSSSEKQRGAVLARTRSIFGECLRASHFAPGQLR